MFLINFVLIMVMKDFNTTQKNEILKSEQEIYKKEGIYYKLKLKDYSLIIYILYI